MDYSDAIFVRVKDEDFKREQDTEAVKDLAHRLGIQLDDVFTNELSDGYHDVQLVLPQHPDRVFTDWRPLADDWNQRNPKFQLKETILGGVAEHLTDD